MSTTYQTRSDNLKRAQRLIFGPEEYAPFVLAPGAQIYVIDQSVPFPMMLTSLTSILSAGTVTANVQRVRAGVTVSITGLSAVSVTTASLVSVPTAPSDGTNFLVAGDILQVTLSSPSSAANLALALRVQRT